MKISLKWLSDFLLPGVDAERAAEALTHGGLPVEVIEKHGDDTVIDVEVTSNRSDCLCQVGAARELAALLGQQFKNVAPSAKESGEPVEKAISVAIDASDLCPHYTARVIRGVKIGPSPVEIASRLDAVGIRPINNVVDVTNYVMFEMGQPLHAFDLKKISGNKIIVRRAKKGETILSIDGHKRPLDEQMLVIADAEKPVALAGVMGGQDSEVADSTTDILLESARFDPLSVRRTARALAMKSDSSYRFERGIDPTLPKRASLRAAELILKTAGGTLLAGIAEAGDEGYAVKKLTLRLARLKQILGVELPVERIMAAFTALGFQPAHGSDLIAVTVPSHRLDVGQEIDLVEEAARTVGYDNIPTREQISITITPPDMQSRTIQTICTTLVGGGYFESITFSFVSDGLRGAFGNSKLSAAAAVRKADASLRPSLLPGLLEAAAHNQSVGNGQVRLFEIGSVFAVDSGKPAEKRVVSFIGGDFRQARGMVEAICAKLDAQRAVIVEPDARAGFARGAGGKITWGGAAIGFIGRIDKSVADKLSLRHEPYGAEMDMRPLLEGHRHVPQLQPLPRFPEVRRDLSLLVAENVRYEAIDGIVRGLNLPFLESVDYVTTYRGKPLDSGTKSVTITLVFRSPSATLTSEEVEASVGRATAALKEQSGAAIRQ